MQSIVLVSIVLVNTLENELQKIQKGCVARTRLAEKMHHHLLEYRPCMRT